MQIPIKPNREQEKELLKEFAGMYEAHEEKNTMAADSALDYSAKSINLQMGSI